MLTKQEKEEAELRRKLVRNVMLSAENVATGISVSSAFSIRAFGKKVFVSVDHPSEDGGVVIDTTNYERRLIGEQ